jgi:hypothetical protein
MMTIFRNKNLGLSPYSPQLLFAMCFSMVMSSHAKRKDTNHEHYTYIPKLLCDMHALQLGMYALLE